MAFDWKKPTVQMLGRWQPWHEGHTELFKRAFSKTGQVCIMIRDMQTNENNPLAGGQVSEIIQSTLETQGFTYNQEYVIISVPNITNITYGRDVGYTITQEKLDKEIESISATKIRQQGNI